MELKYNSANSIYTSDISLCQAAIFTAKSRLGSTKHLMQKVSVRRNQTVTVFLVNSIVASIIKIKLIFQTSYPSSCTWVTSESFLQQPKGVSFSA